LEHALNSAEPGSEQQRVYGDLLEEIQRLKSITQKLLLLAKADAGQLKLELQPMNLSSAVLELVEDACDLNESLQIEHAVQPGVQVKTDADLLQQVLQNLLSNAAKYNQPEGSIRFELSANATHASLRVGNTGPGIPESARPRIFERFFRADPSRNREIGGSGLGLSLSREIVRAHGGELDLESAANGWTWFHLRLPLA